MKKDLDKMLKNIESTEPSHRFEFRGEKAFSNTERKVIPFYRRKVFVTVTAAVLAIAVAITVLIPLSKLVNVENGTEVLTYTPIKPDISYIRPPEESINSVGLPWENGSLKLTTLSNSGISQPAVSLTSASVESPTSENIDLSFMGSTEIVSCTDGNLVRIDTHKGEHADCDGVYYNIEENEIMCVACAIKESVKKEPYYIDACIRALIEECILTEKELGITHNIEERYSDLIDIFYENGADQIFMRGEMPTVQNLKVDVGTTYLFGQNFEQNLTGYSYPMISILEFGLSTEYCIYGISSLVSDASWGNFKIELETGVVTSLNGDNGEYLKNGSVLYNYDSSKVYTADLYGFKSIDVASDYSFAVVTTPFFSAENDSQNDTAASNKDDRKEDNVFIIDLQSGNFTVLLGENRNYLPEDITARPYPKQAAQIVDGTVCFPTKRDTWYFYYGNACELEGELIMICTLDGIKYAVMQQGDQSVYYRLDNGADVSEDIENNEIVLPDGYRTVSSPVSVSDSSVSVWSKDGAYKYSYQKGDNKIICVETVTGIMGELRVPEDFLNSVTDLKGVRFCMFLNNSGTRLILTYFGGVKVSENII